MTTLQSANQESIESWSANAEVWDQLMGEGSPFQEEIVNPSLFEIMPMIKLPMRILEIGCGNGHLARKLAKSGAHVTAIDGSPEAIRIAKERTSSALDDRLEFLSLDACNPNSYEQFEQLFDLVICNMAFMDIADIQSVFFNVIDVLHVGGSFIVTQTHPCFEKAVGPIFCDMVQENGNVSHKYGVKVSKYLSTFAMKVKAVPTLPEEHYFFHRPLSKIFSWAFNAGFVLDRFKEAAFSEDSALTEHRGWHYLTEVPVVAAMRFRK